MGVHSRRNIILGGGFVLVFAIVGSVLLFNSHASTPTETLEAEAGVTNGSTVRSDSSASGGSEILFGGATSLNPSGVALPAGNLTYGGHTFTRSFADDFATNVALGNWPGPYASTWGGYTDGTPDTAGKNNGTPSGYYPTQVLSVSNGELDWYLHTTNGTHMAATPFPNAGTPFTYGAYSFRFKSDSLPGFKTAWLLWPATWQWTDEVDYPEGNLDSTIGGAGHCYDAGGEARDNCTIVHTTSYYTSWHTGTVVWTPGHIDFLLDGVVVGQQTSGVSAESMRLLLQTESCLTGCPADSTAGHLDLDWVVMYNY